MFKWLLVGGTFDESIGKPSGYIRKFSEQFKKINPNGVIVNGGSYNDLEAAYRTISDCAVVLWFASVDNTQDKGMVRDLKKYHPKVLLVTSKNNLDKKYSTQDLIARMLQNKSNLMIEFSTCGEGNEFTGSLLDPLGNMYCSTTSIYELTTKLICRLEKLLKYTRYKSVPTLVLPDGYVPQKVDPIFSGIIRQSADKFHELIHGTNTTRFLGNCSFRCEQGFPSFRGNGIVYVSRRNVDKRSIGEDMFVPVSFSTGKDAVEYFGEHKPSVDTPIQLALYERYPEIKYMLHSHCYIERKQSLRDLLWTVEPIPCGAFEEFYEIINEYPNEIPAQSNGVCINLMGHGSIVMAKDLSIFKDIEYISRPMPERL